MRNVEAPEFLKRTFDVDALRDERGAVVALDREGVIVWVNPAWERFAKENGAPEVVERFGPGARYLDGITGPLAPFFAEALERTRRTGEPWEMDYECSSPETWRLHHMRVMPIAEDGLLVEHSEVRARPHDRAACAPVEEAFRDEHGLMLQCSNCRRVHRVGDGWEWVVSWVRSAPAPVSHGLCASCAGHYLAATRRARRARREETL